MSDMADMTAMPRVGDSGNVFCPSVQLNIARPQLSSSSKYIICSCCNFTLNYGHVTYQEKVYLKLVFLEVPFSIGGIFLTACPQCSHARTFLKDTSRKLKSRPKVGLLLKNRPLHSSGHIQKVAESIETLSAYDRKRKTQK